jgi:hypothetical protein
VRKRKGYLSEIFDGEPEVHGSTLSKPVAEEIPDLFERGPLAEKMNSVGMPKAVRAL